MTAAIVWMIVVAYLVVAVAYARGRIRHWYRTGSDIDFTDGVDRMAATLAALGLGLIWPVSMLAAELRQWMCRPVDVDLERMERLRSDYQDWRAKERQATAEEDRRLAKDIADTLDELLRGRR